MRINQGKGRKQGRYGQSIVNYVLLLSIIIAALIGMKVYLRRAVQAKVKDLTDALIAPASRHLTAVNPVVPLLGRVNTSAGKYLAKQSSSDRKSVV